MTLAFNGLTSSVIHDVMPPYSLRTGLLQATLAALPPPPDAATWRQTRITRWPQEIATLMPANAAQARRTAQSLIMREPANTLATQAYAPAITVQQMWRRGHRRRPTPDCPRR